MMEFIHTDKYGQAFKIAEKFVSSHKHRPVLTYINHVSDGTMFATDSHVAIKIKDIHGFKEDYLVNPHTIDFAKGNYPDVDRIIKLPETDFTIKLNKEQIRIWLQMHRSLNQVIKQSYKGRNYVTLEFNEVINLKIDDKNEITVNLPYEDYNKPEELKNISYNVAYMRDCLEAHTVMESESVEITVNGMKPIFLDNKVDVVSLVLPVRRG